jgi:transcriptional regulator with XRE-family HTH domain
MPYGDKIKQLREAAGLKQLDIATAVGVSTQAVSKWETNKSEPDRDAIKILCELFKVTSDEILGIEKNTSIPADDDIKFALFGDPHNITDAQFEEVKRFARYVEEHYHKKD